MLTETRKDLREQTDTQMLYNSATQNSPARRSIVSKEQIAVLLAKHSHHLEHNDSDEHEPASPARATQLQQQSPLQRRRRHLRARSHSNEHEWEKLRALLATPPLQRSAEIIFKVNISLGQTLFMQQLGVALRTRVSRSVTALELKEGSVLQLRDGCEFADLYILLSGALLCEQLAVTYTAGDTVGYRPR
jgi:hypothetical protein